LVSLAATDISFQQAAVVDDDTAVQLQPLEAFSGFDARELQALAECCDLLTVRPGERVVRAGEAWNAVYVVVSGRIRLVNEHASGSLVTINTFQAGATVGEQCLYTDAFAEFSVQGAASTTTLLRLPLERIEALRKQHLSIDCKLEAYARRQALHNFLSRQPNPIDSPKAQLDELVQALGQQELPAGAVLTQPGQQEESLYLVTSGRLRITQTQALEQEGQIRQRGEVIGELSAGTGKGVTARVVAETAATVLMLPKAQLRSVLFRQEEPSTSPDAPGDQLPQQTVEEHQPAKTETTTTPSLLQRLQRFLVYVQPHARLLGEIALASFVLQVFTIFLPLFIRFIVDDVIIKQDQWWLFYSLLGISGVVLLHLVLSYCRQQLLLLVSRKAASQLTSDFYTQVLSLPLPFFIKSKVGDITSRFEENQKVTDFLSDIGPQLFFNLFTVALYLGLMSYFNVQLTLVTLGFVALHILIMGGVAPLLQRAYRDSFQKGADSESFLIECLKGLSTIKMLAIEHRTRWAWENLYIRFSNAYFRSLTYGMGANLASGFVANSSEVGVLFYGGLMVLRQQMTVGELTAFIFLIQGVTAPLIKLVMFWASFQATLNAADRLNEVFDEKPELSLEAARQQRMLPQLQGHVRFEHVSFRYEVNSKTTFLQDINLEIQPGQRIAFVGRSGSGKSTLLKLLLGFYPPLSGTLSIDGFDLTQAWLPSLRQQIGIIPQTTHLFRGTIRENIALAKPGASLAEIMNAARMAAAHEFISALPQGYSTMVDTEGMNLSGGQRQRLAIARGLLHNPRLLILDEATSALDNETERVVIHNIEEQFKDRTIFMTAHRLSTVRHADLIVVIDQGKILEQGSHEQLLARKGLYYFLSAQQTEL